MPAAFNEGSGELSHSEKALRWYYTIPGPRHHIIVMDTRTQRLYLSPKEFPGLLSPGAMQRQIVAVTRKDAEVTVIISAAPVLGVGFLEAIQFWRRLRFRDNYAFDRRLEKRKNTLAEVILHREEWLSKWKAGAHIVGYANIGEICFRWTAEEKKVFQRLWWWRPGDTECPNVATEYQETLDLPEPDEAPRLP